jgi:pectate lyase
MKRSRILPAILGFAAVLATAAWSGEPSGPSFPAFLGAEGFGAATPGGRGGKVLIVANLDDHGPGSLRAAVEESGARTVVFEVSGTIALERPLRIERPFLTIAGQTAPGGGIALKNHGIVLTDGVQDVVIRHIRVRPGPGAVSDGILLAGKEGAPVRRVILDHCSATWAMDENMDTWGGVEDCTIQWCILAEGLMEGHPKGKGHGMGLLCGPRDKTQRLSIHHNLFAHNNQRNPRFQGGSYEFVNNAIYDWGGIAGQLTFAPRANFIGNFYKPGPSSNKRAFEIAVDGPTPLYVEGNIGPHRRPPAEGVQGANPYPFSEYKSDEWAIVGQDGKAADASLRRNEPHPPAPIPITIEPVAQAFERVLADCGATRPTRDGVDRRIVTEVRAGTGALGMHGPYPILDEGVAPADEDRDGMPNQWEREFGLDYLDPHDAATDLDGDGYTNLEEYLNATDPQLKGK